MKSLLLSLLLLISSLVVVAPSCSNASKVGESMNKLDPIHVEQISSLVKIGTYYAVVASIEKEPWTSYAYLSAANAIDLAVKGDKFDPTEVKALIKKAIAEQNVLIEASVDLSLDLALLKYQEFYNLNIKNYKDDNHVFASFLTAIGSGIRSGVTQSGSPETATPAPAENPLVELDAKDLTLPAAP